MDVMNKKDFMNTNNIVLDYQNKDEAGCSVAITDSSLNYYGYVHGGLYFGLADATAGYTASSDGEHYVTLNASINYMLAVKKGMLRCKGRVLQRTRKTCVVSIEIYNDENLLCDTATFTMFQVRK